MAASGTQGCCWLGGTPGLSGVSADPPASLIGALPMMSCSVSLQAALVPWTPWQDPGLAPLCHSLSCTALQQRVGVRQALVPCFHTSTI